MNKTNDPIQVRRSIDLISIESSKNYFKKRSFDPWSETVDDHTR